MSSAESRRSVLQTRKKTAPWAGRLNDFPVCCLHDAGESFIVLKVVLVIIIVVIEAVGIGVEL